MSIPVTDVPPANPTCYQAFLAERNEILRHKWIESQKAGYDIGFEKALLDWVVKHRHNWFISWHNDHPHLAVAA